MTATWEGRYLGRKPTYKKEKASTMCMFCEFFTPLNLSSFYPFFIASLFVAAKENFSGCHQKLYLDCFPFANCVWIGSDPVCKFLWLSPSCVWIGSHLQCFPIDSRLKICKGRIQLFIRASSLTPYAFKFNTS